MSALVPTHALARAMLIALATLLPEAASGAPIASQTAHAASIFAPDHPVELGPTPNTAPTRIVRIDPTGDEIQHARAIDEPFGLIALESPENGLWQKWRGVARAIEAEAEILTLCRSDPDICPSAAARRFLAIIESGRARQGRARLGEINRAINLSIRPMSDLAQYGVPDLWSSPLATLTAGAGDCEDYAIAKYVALREAGIAETDLRLVIVHDARAGDDHAVVAARLDSHWLILDNRWLVLNEDADLKQFVPLFAIDRDGVKRLVSAAEQPAGERRFNTSPAASAPLHQPM